MKLELQNIVKRYGTKTALCNVSATLTSGSLIGLVGPNGAGKSTLLSLLATLAKPTEGDICLASLFPARFCCFHFVAL